MAWNDATLLESKLKIALDTFNWPEAELICNDVISRINTDPDLIPESTAKRLLQGLRRKRCFNLMTSLADAIMQSGLRTPQICRQYAQALIDQGTLGAAEVVLQSIIQNSQGDMNEALEARGLTGRIYKQLYVNRKDPNSIRNRAVLARALNEYLYVYDLNPYQHLWHGINVVALADRARRDELPVVGRADAVTLANEILTTLADRESKIADCDRSLDAWDIATMVEAYVALGFNDKSEEGRQEYFKKAEEQALRYIASDDADAFEIASTTRQFTEVWQLDDKNPPGNHLLPILNAGYLRKQGAAMERSPMMVQNEAATVGDAAKDLEAMFGTKMVTLEWYKKGLEQCYSVARVERLDGSGKGTAWLVKAGDFFPNRQGVLLLTNAHVVSDNPNPFSNLGALYPSDVKINFQALGKGGLEVEDEVVWTSPPNDLDATFLVLKGDPPSDPLTIHDKAVQMASPSPRLYIIGHPLGEKLHLSLQDNFLLDCNDRLLHYRTPTDRGSSGSPVFEHEFWRVVALHHKGSKKMQRLDNQPGDYEANEGIALEGLKKVTQNQTAPVIVTHQGLNQAIMKAQAGAIMEAVKAPDTDGYESAGPPATDEEAAQVMEELSRALKTLEAEEQVPGVLVSPDDMLTSVLQSLAEDSLKAGKASPGVGSDFEAQFDEHDVIGWAKSLLTWVRGMKPHKWLTAPPGPDALPNSFRAAVLGDWGSGLYGAPVCAASIQNDPKDYGLLLHLGDVYYSGTDREVMDRFLNLWPNKPKAVSRACNANHEMYTGGYAYFDQILKQFNQPASYFALQNDAWLLIGLDSAYKEWELVNEQVEWLTNLVGSAGNRRVVLFSHHQLFSWADKTQTKMQSQLGDLLTSKKLFAWYWGHEHRCVMYDQHPVWGLFGRCIGHSGYPYFRDKFTEGATVENGPQNTSWRKVDAKNLVPGALILEGSNPYVPGHTEKYGPQGYLTLEFSGEHLNEIVQTPDGSVAYERQLT